MRIMARRPSAKSAAGSIGAATRVLVLYGAEPMLMRQHLEQLTAALEKAHGETESFSFDGRTRAVADVLDELRSFSLMQCYKIVIVDDADQFVSAHRAALERYAQSPVDHATLVLRSGKWRRGNLDKLIVKVGAIVSCDTPTPAGAQTWLVGRSKSQHQHTLSQNAAALLVRRIGPDLGRLDSELAKLVLLAGPGERIDARLIERIVGRDSDEQAYEIQEALLESLAGRAGSAPGSRGAIEKIHELVHVSRQADVLIAYFVADLVRKLHVAAHLRRQGVTDAAIAREVGIFGGRRASFFEALRGLDVRVIGDLFDAIVDADARSKSGLGDPVRNVERFCVTLASGAGRS